MKKVALITGVSGQDGSYLAELLLERDYRIIGTARNILEASVRLPKGLIGKVEFVEWDMLGYKKIVEILSFYRPNEIYNLAAFSSGTKMFEDPIGMTEVNGLAITRILEAVREVDLKIRFCQASSREVFGEPIESPQTELTLTNPRNPYGVAKCYADSMIRIYRERFGIFGCSAILFNHESPRRRLEFVTKKVTHEAAKIKLGLAHNLDLGNMEAYRDWGFAGDYVSAMWLMLQQDQADDYVVASGKAHSVRELCEYTFSYLGMDYRNYVRDDPKVFRPQEDLLSIGCSVKANNQLGWKPKIEFRELVHMMVDADLRDLNHKN